jgi:hypothetical protein
MSSISSKEKVIIINGKRFVVGNSKIKPTKCPDYNNSNRKKLLTKEEMLRQKVDKKNINKKKKIASRQSKRISRKRRDGV